MNGMVQFRLCTLTDKELAERANRQIDELYITQKIPVRHMPARPDDDFDLLVGELIMRFTERIDDE